MSEWSQHKVWSTDSKDKGIPIHPAGESKQLKHAELALLFVLLYYDYYFYQETEENTKRRLTVLNFLDLCRKGSNGHFRLSQRSKINMLPLLKFGFKK